MKLETQGDKKHEALLKSAARCPVDRRSDTISKCSASANVVINYAIMQLNPDPIKSSFKLIYVNHPYNSSRAQCHGSEGRGEERKYLSLSFIMPTSDELEWSREVFRLV